MGSFSGVRETLEVARWERSCGDRPKPSIAAGASGSDVTSALPQRRLAGARTEGIVEDVEPSDGSADTVRLPKRRQGKCRSLEGFSCGNQGARGATE